MASEEICELMGQRIKAERLRQNITQKTLAAMAGLSLPTVQRFESNGSGTFETFASLTIALRRPGDLEEVFVPPAAKSIKQILAEQSQPTRQRATGSRRDHSHNTTSAASTLEK